MGLRIVWEIIFFKLVEIILGGLRFFWSNRDLTGRGVALLHGDVKGFFREEIIKTL